MSSREVFDRALAARLNLESIRDTLYLDSHTKELNVIRKHILLAENAAEFLLDKLERERGSLTI